jgi:hypothetical protein
MFSKRSFIAAAVCAVALPLAACGGSDSKDPPGVDANTPPSNTPEGTHYGYVVSKAYVPASKAQARDYGLDLGAAKSGTPDGTIDNILGEAFVTLASQGFDIQGTITSAIDTGSIMLLLDYQTKDFTTAALSGFSVKLGATSTPPACADANDTACRHHLDGTASFTLSASSPANALVTGAVVSSTFTGGPGNLSLQVAVGSTDPVQLNLHNARAKVTGASATGLTAVIGGALTVTDLNTSVIPAIQKTLEGVLLADCGPVADRVVDMACSCDPTTSAITILGLFDGDITGSVKDCAITVEEIIQSNFIKAVLAPDICSTATCTAPDALSFGIKVDAVKATF